MGNRIRIGKVTIGLYGLEGAVASVKAADEKGLLKPEEAAARILELIEKRNYIPESARNEYIRALARLWSGDAQENDASELHLSIRILGPGCVSCNRLEEIVRSILDQEGTAADIEHVHDLDEIWRYGVAHTPALVINEKVFCSGRLPTRAQVEAWIRELKGA